MYDGRIGIPVKKARGRKRGEGGGKLMQTWLKVRRGWGQEGMDGGGGGGGGWQGLRRKRCVTAVLL